MIGLPGPTLNFNFFSFIFRKIILKISSVFEYWRLKQGTTDELSEEACMC